MVMASGNQTSSPATRYLRREAATKIPVQWQAQEPPQLPDEADDDASAVLNPNLRTVFAINRKIVNTAIGRDVAASLEAYGKPVLKSEVCQRVAFAESAAQGKTVFEVDEKSAAAEEIEALAAEILGL